MSGTHSFTYVSNDGLADSAQATVTITVTAVNDAPVALDDPSYSTDEDVPLSVDALGGVLANDSDVDGDPLTASPVSGPSSGNLTLGADGSFTYTPAPNYNGEASFTYVANDGLVASAPATVTITVSEVNDAPVAVDDAVSVEQNGSVTFDPVSNSTAPPVEGVQVDFDVENNPLAIGELGIPSHGQATRDGNLVTYTPDQNYVGPDSFTYEISDDQGGSDQGTIQVSVVDTVPDWSFIGLLDPYQFPEPPNSVYTVKLGSAFPARWQYADPPTGLVVESSDALPVVRVVGPVDCSDGSEANGELQVFTPGNSTYQYDTRLDIHQLNVDTDNLLNGGNRTCFNLYVESQKTRQIDGPFIFRTRK